MTYLSNPTMTDGPIRLARAFKIDTLGRLTGIHSDQSVWKPGISQAECDYGHDHGADHRDGRRTFHSCSCGYYGYTDPGDVMVGRAGYIAGVVTVHPTGLIVKGANGIFRAEQAEVIALHLPGSATAKDRFLRWVHRHDNPLMFPAMLLAVLSTIALMVALVGPDEGDGPIPWEWWQPFIGVVLAAVIFTVVRLAEKHDDKNTGEWLSPASRAKIIRNYPGAAIYTDRDSMFAALMPTPEPDPDDPDFWAAPVTGHMG